MGNGIYWAITTVTTVGYGDVSPKTAEGKAIAIMVMLVGIGFAALVIGAAAQRFIRPTLREVDMTDADIAQEVRELAERLQRIETALQHRKSPR